MVYVSWDMQTEAAATSVNISYDATRGGHSEWPESNQPARCDTGSLKVM